MGVPGLQTWLRRRYPEAFVSLPEGMAFDHVYIDMSSTLHQVIRRARTKSYFHSQLHRRLDEILALARPQQRVVLALDGPAPLAKLLEQRRRRRREVERSQRLAAAAAESAAADAAAAASGAALPSGLTAGSAQQAWSSTVDALALQGGFRPPNPELSTLALTTGSRLMLEVHSSLAAYICKKLADPATAHLSFEFSDSTVKGEGELKILSRLLHPGSAAQPGETHLVLGGDSDLLLMALVSGQPGVYILNDLMDGDSRRPQRRRHRHPTENAVAAAAAAAAADAAAAVAAAAAAEALLAAPAAEFSDEESEEGASSGSGSDSEAESGESDSEPEKGVAAAAGDDGLSPGVRVRKLPALAAVAAAAASQAEASQPPLVAFSRDVAEQLWRGQHLAGGGAGPEEVTGLALDLMLLATMCSGNDYLPAIQGMQLSNKHRPGLWDLYCGMRQEPEWEGQTLVLRGCGCGGAGAGARGRDCPSIAFNWPMLTALLSEYHRQRFVSLEGPLAAVARGQGADLGAAPAGSSPATASLSSGSLSSIDLAEVPAPVWGREGLAAAAAAATAQHPDKPAGEGAEQPRQQRSKGPAVALRGMDPRPDSYLQGLEWVLQMYCSGAVRDYRFAYDLAAPSLTHLIAIMQQRCTGDGGGSSSDNERPQQQQPAEGELQAWAAAVADETAQQQQQRQRRSTQPLVPAACAMALLPRGGRMHAATALQHLMDEGSQLEEIYATCDECTQLGVQLGSMGRELDGARAELAAAQLQLGELASEAVAGGAVAAPAVEVLEVEVERLEGEVARLRELVSALSRRQQEHLIDAHPYRPFPTEELEAAVAAVPLDAYPRRERKLAQFGREFVFRRAPASLEEGAAAGLPGPSSLQQKPRQAAAGTAEGAEVLTQAGGLATLARAETRLAVGAAQAAAASQEGQQQQQQQQQQRQQQRERVQPWVLECLSFAAAYPRVADPLLLRRSGSRVERDVLPLRPYMQPPHMQHRADGTAGRPTALLARCQLARWGPSRPDAWHAHGQQHHHHHKRTPRRLGPRLHLPAAAAVAAGQQLGQRSRLHTFSLGWSRSGGSSGGSGGSGTGRGVSRAQLATTAVRSTLLQGCTRLLGSIRMLRPF